MGYNDYMKTTASQLRANLYKLLDQVLETKEPIEIERNGQIIKIVPPGYAEPKPYKPKNKFSQLKDRKSFYKCDPEDLFQNDWLKDWKP